MGKHNFNPTKSLFGHPDPKRLLIRFKGTGIPVGGKISAGYTEVVDFKEYIGLWKDQVGNALPTTRGKIHYSKSDTHIIPAHSTGKG